MKMEKLSSTTKGVCELENYHYMEEQKRPLLFHTWPTAHFCEWFFLPRFSGVHHADIALRVRCARKLTGSEIQFSSVHREGRRWGGLRRAFLLGCSYLTISKDC